MAALVAIIPRPGSTEERIARTAVESCGMSVSTRCKFGEMGGHTEEICALGQRLDVGNPSDSS